MSVLIKRLMPVSIVILIMAVLVGCQQVADTRAEFCQNLRDIGTQAAAFKNTKIDQPIADVQAKMDQLEKTRQNLSRLARLTNNTSIDKLNSAIDQIASAVSEFKTNQAAPVIAKIQAGADAAAQAYQELNDAVCAAK